MFTVAKLRVHSSTFSEGGKLPLSAAFNGFGHHGNNRSPHLAWSGAPAEAKSFAIECHDPDAPTGGVGFTHWVLFDIPASVTELGENAAASGLPPGCKQGLNDLGTPGYVGPCPPPGPRHRYVFTVYALPEATLGLGETTTLAVLRFMIRDMKLGQGAITGLYGA